ncbi:cob(I)yrinic acid a,c-diamide adenosyltransferase [Hathewaya histolytica]|uniref:cob(I)yrinic acid a,c-diamide adenosyltransferase n=1 Tax=Hathewaya histolytica TaxID=1498 RepID=UPI003B67E757
MKIYTKTGDKGTTSNLLGERVPKSDITMELQGQVDEINSGVGYLRSLLKELGFTPKVAHTDEILKEIQYNLYKIGIDIASRFTKHHILDSHVEVLEEEIDRMVNQMPPLKSFIYYSGSKEGTYAHVIRATTRRSERTFVKALAELNAEYPADYQYVNRLSDYFHTLARYMNFLQGVPDEPMILRD